MIITKNKLGSRHWLLAIAIFLGMGTAPAQADTDSTDKSLHVSGTRETVTQSENISLTENGAVAIQVGGVENRLIIPHDKIINVSGKFGKGILIYDGRRHILQADGNIFSAANAVEFNFRGDEFTDALVETFNLSGTLFGRENAIYIGEKSLVKNINIDAGAEIYGNIVSTFKANSDLATNLNINSDFNYGGNIFGAEGIKLHVKKGTMNFSGTANILSVDVGFGAKLFGGSFTLNNVNENGDISAGTFINHGTIGANSPNTNLIINGNLISDGILQKVSGGTAGSIIVNGNANIEGSIASTDSLVPNETATVLTAKSITGNVKNTKDNPFQISAMLTATGEVVGNTLLVTTHEAQYFGGLNSGEKKIFDAMNNMREKLDGQKLDEMREFYNLNLTEAKHTLSQIGSNDSAQIMSVAQQSNAVDRLISERVSKVFAPEYIDVNVHPIKFSDDEDNSPEMTVKVKMPSRQENNFWLNYMKNWGSLRGGTDYHGSVIVGGYDRSFGQKWRAGIFATYGTIGYGAESSRATVYDTRLGLYAGYHNRQSDVYFYINGGQLRNSLHRGISSLGLSTNANYKSRIIEVGGEYKYDLSPKKIWHVSPFINFQASHLKQNSYNERGAGIYNQHVDTNSNTYFAAQTGLDFKRYYRRGMIGMRFGVKHGFTGADPDLHISYEGDTSSSYRLRQKRDKTHLVLSVRGESEFARGWFMGAEAELQRGENDRDVTASLMFRRIW